MKKKLFITWATYNSRTSERMIKYRVKKDEWYFLDLENRVIIYNLICDKLEELWFKNNFILNVLSDHIHLVLEYEENNLEKLIKNLKWYVAFKFLHLKWFTKSWEWFQNKLWARSFSKTYLDTDEHLKKAITYTLENHNKHEIDDLYKYVSRWKVM
jgi:REP element-mobilizing transposase RayT